jgi:hypothetical protein
VTLYARSKHISASSDELEYALLDGCELVQGKAICEINERGPVFRTAIFDEEDRVVGYEEELDQVECDTVVVAVSQKPKNKLILTTEKDAVRLRELASSDLMAGLPIYFLPITVRIDPSAEQDFDHTIESIVHENVSFLERMKKTTFNS